VAWHGRDAESTPSLLKMLEALALDGKGEATVFGDSKTWTPAVAALLNGALGHSLDFDDTHADSSLHPSAPVVPAAFAVGELVGASGRDVLTAIRRGPMKSAAGSATRSTRPRITKRGFHPTATAGTYGAAAAAAKLFRLSKAQIVAAFGVSGSQAAGLAAVFWSTVPGTSATQVGAARDEWRDRGHARAQRFRWRYTRIGRGASMACLVGYTATTAQSGQGRRGPWAKSTRP